MNHHLRLFLCVLLLLFAGMVRAEEVSSEAPELSADSKSFFSTQLLQEPTRERNPFWFPTLSLLLPGFDQFLEKQYNSGFVYSGGALVGMGITANATSEFDGDDDESEDIEGAGDLDETDDRLKRQVYGASLYQFMGSMSAYHSFRTAVRSYHNSGSSRFSFLKPTIHEDSGDLMLAPFEFSFLKRTTTWLPLVGLAGLVAYSYAASDDDIGELTASEGVFLSGISYNAGVGEEALFRGWLFPYLYDQTQSYFWANSLQAAFFAYLHATPTYQVPVIQFFGGYYFGYLAEKNNWSLEEAVFVHTWWDVIAFTALFLNEDTRDQAQIRLPLLDLTF